MNHKVEVKGVTVANQWLQTAKRVDSVSAPHTLPLISPDQLDLWFNQIKSSVSNTLWSTEFIWLHFYKILNAGWAAASLEQVTPCEALHWKQQHCLHPQLCPHSPDCPTFKKPILLVFPHSFGAMFLAEIFLLERQKKSRISHIRSLSAFCLHWYNIYLITLGLQGMLHIPT